MKNHSQVFAIAEDGKQSVVLKPERAYPLTVGGGKPGQCYPCVLIVKDDEDTNRKKILSLGRR